ncbi:ATP-dependent helicase/nuclease subunit A [Alkalibacterium subtropicum]|uniref:ATP-dependent helicase/nuclease subunit A n=1 Tax=Alkalibacterium subtropicum TaxID=753702 RepID=A0A1I1EWM0_9LACT|nr:site-specific integrase [Alkalibacterium subtropicum]SFB89898.1 ATP-dependent helicase/nuclease subunit A [Alkalibacterium subtropicum]
MKGSVRKRGNRWYYFFDAAPINGKRQVIERAGGDTKAEALDALRKALNEYDKSGSIVEESNLSVHDYFEYWFEDYVMRNLKYNTQENYRNILDKHIYPYIGGYRLRGIQPSTVQKVIDKNFEKGLSKKTLSIIKTVLNGGFRRAVFPYQYVKQDPTRFITMPKYDERNKSTKEDLKILKVADFKRMKDIVGQASPFYIPMMIAFYTGLRRGEVSGLRWSDIDYDEQTLTVERIIIMKKKEVTVGTPKTQSSYRTIGIGNELISALRTHRKRQLENKLFYGQHYIDSEYICTKENGSLVTPNSIKWHAEKTKKEMGIDFNFHSFRHTHASLLLESGAKIKAIQERLGHSKIATTMDTYSHLTKKTKKETVDLFENLMK